jgi:signal peptidase I
MATKARGDEGGFLETVKVIIQALLIAVVVRTLLFQPFNIPSGSLIPTLLIGDYLFVSKYSYGYSRHSMPFSPPLFSGRIWGSEPKRGDIAVFKLPKDGSTDYIKRVIGLPGERIQVLEGVLHINGRAVKRERIADYRTTDPYGRTVSVPQYRETLPEGTSHNIIERDGDRGYWDNTGAYTVPAGHFLMMGDNRDNSTDSRDESSVGFVPYENFVGRAEIIFFSIDENASAWRLWDGPGRCAGSACSGRSSDRVAVSRHKPDVAALEARLGHRFADPGLLSQALTHVRATKDGGGTGATYQRLEFLGDRVLGLAASAMLFRAFPEASEGDLSRRLSDLVRRETCAAVARDWDVGPHIALDPGARAAGRRSVAILGDVCEALIGAVFMDGGYGAAFALVERAFGARMQAHAEPPHSPKQVLQEWALARALPPPTYTIVERFGPDHAPRFRVAASLPGTAPAEGLGTSKRAAEQEAAQNLLVSRGAVDAGRYGARTAEAGA